MARAARRLRALSTPRPPVVTRRPPPEQRGGAARWLPPVAATLLLAVVGFLVWYFLFDSNDAQTSSKVETGKITASTTILDFGDEDLGKRSADQSVTLTNGQTEPLGISSIAIEGHNPKEFGLTKSTTCSTEAPLNEGDSCGVGVRFHPRVRGPRSAVLLIEFDGDRGSRSIQLRGTGTGAPAVVVETTLLDFGNVELETKPETRQVELTNVGNAPLRIEQIAVEGPGAGRFVIDRKKSCSPSKRVKAKAACVVTVSFTPTKLGPSQATLVITHDAQGSPTKVELRGVGTGTPKAAVNPGTIDFGNVTVATKTQPRSVTVTNSGTDTLRLGSIDLGGSDAADFRIVAGGSCSNGLRLAPGKGCTVEIQFSPAQKGQRKAKLVLTTNTDDSPQTVILQGEGKQAAAAARTGTGKNSTA